MTRLDFLYRFYCQTPVDYLLPSTSIYRDKAKLSSASVLIGLVERQGELHIILTQRAKHLKHHPGQVSFPGGKKEPQDANLAQTAIRETTEEIGIDSKSITLFGTLPPLMTLSGFLVTPQLAFVDPNYNVHIDSNEVASVFEVPCSRLFQPNSFQTLLIPFQGQQHRILGMFYGNYFIWGMTAQILQALQRQLVH